MKQLEISNQPRLPLRKQVQICADGILHRLFRSLITLAIVTLAVAFLMNVLTESVFATACKQGVTSRLSERQTLEQIASLIETPLTTTALRQRLAELDAGSTSAMILARWTDLGEAELAPIAAQAASAQALHQWLGDLGLGYRRVLLDNRDAEAALAGLAEPAFREAFEQRLPQYPISPPPDLEATLAILPVLHDALAEAVAQFNERVRRLDTATGRMGFGGFLAQHAGDRAAQRALLDESELGVLEPQLDLLTEQAQRRSRMQQLMALLQNPSMARLWAPRYGAGTTDDALAALAASQEEADWFASQAAGLDLGVVPPAASLHEAAGALVHERELEALKRSLFANYGPQPGMSASVFWLIVVSMMLCMVGITNAMLVSVLERFRDIATMKCLGALDGFIATLFLLEAAFLGLSGGLAGVLLGAAVGSTRMWSTYGGWLMTFFPAGALAQAAALSVLAGLTLTTMAAIYPAARAARMPPLEAMRVE